MREVFKAWISQREISLKCKRNQMVAAVESVKLSTAAGTWPTSTLTPAHAHEPLVFVDHFDAEFACKLQLRTGTRPGNDQIGLGGH